MNNYPLSRKSDHQRRFQPDWFKMFPNWLEYSPTKDAAFCLPCFLFNKRPTGHPGSNAFTIEGFKN